MSQVHKTLLAGQHTAFSIMVMKEDEMNNDAVTDTARHCYNCQNDRLIIISDLASAVS